MHFQHTQWEGVRRNAMHGSRRADSKDIRCQTSLFIYIVPLHIPIIIYAKILFKRFIQMTFPRHRNCSETKYLSYDGHYRLMTISIQTRGRFYKVPGSTAVVVHVLVRYPWVWSERAQQLYTNKKIKTLTKL